MKYETKMWLMFSIYIILGSIAGYLFFIEFNPLFLPFLILGMFGTQDFGYPNEDSV